MKSWQRVMPSYLDQLCDLLGGSVDVLFEHSQIPNLESTLVSTTE
jgi:hypothetical protein